MTTTDLLEVYILAHIDNKAKEIGFVGHAHAQGYGVPHPGTAVHPNYRGSLLDSMAYYMVDDSEYIIWSCECMIMIAPQGMGVLLALQDDGFEMKQISVAEMKRRNALYTPYARKDNRAR